MVQCILLPALAGAPVVGANGHAAHHKTSIRPHFQEIESLDELLQALHGLENRRILGCFSRRVSRREDAVQIVETRASADHELPTFHADIAGFFSLVPRRERIVARLIEVDRFVPVVHVVEGLHATHLLIGCLPHVLRYDHGDIGVGGEIDWPADRPHHLLPQ